MFPLFDFALSFTCVHYGLLCLTIFFPLINKLVHQPLGSLQVHLIDLNEQCLFIFLLLMLMVVIERCLYADWIKECNNHKSSVFYFSHS